MSKQEEIIEVCGKKVVVRYARTQEEACASCAFCSRKECHDLDCNMRDIITESRCRYAYFVPAEGTEADAPAQAQPVPADVLEAAKAYSASVSNGHHFRDLETGYVAGMLAERERQASFPTFKGWVARDKCGELYFFKERPTRGATMWNTEDFCAFMPFPQRNLPSIRWEDEPREVEIIIKEVGK